MRGALPLIAGVLAACPMFGYAQGWKPEKPVEIIIGTSPGGPQDRQGRLLQRVLQARKLVEQPVTVVNKPGGGGAVGLVYIAQHPGDGHFMQIVAQSLLSNHITGRSKMTYTDFTPLAILAVEYVTLVVRVDSPVKDAREFVDRLRKDPSALTVAIGTVAGNATHSSFAHAMRAAGIDVKRLRAVVFNSGSEGMVAAIGGHVDAAAGSVSTVLPQVRAGKLRVLAFGAPARGAGDLASVPTWRELGLDSAVDLWRGLAGPAGMTPAQVAFWDAALARVVKDADWVEYLDRYMMVNSYRNSVDTLKHWQAEYKDVKSLFVEMGLAKQ
ncbi:MAG: hypothetical protein A3G24_12235 [Betaproteobacteria bacterium RIFCSPLOWO2_12_FULL_62_13]|nr:MAG: hypothetical protein A3G24_12235 [Betaproteobacteria bacterium RIFCSPLOWO2_12_FULL_62_13]